MTGGWLAILALCAALGCGLMSGVFFAFSSFVMKALARLAPAQGIAAMNSINVVAVTPLFMAAFFGTGAACLWLAVSAAFAWQKEGSGYLLSGAVLYLVGTILVTAVFNIPRNNALAAVNPANADSARLWTEFVRGWTAWNHVRTASSLAAAALLSLGFNALRA